VLARLPRSFDPPPTGGAPLRPGYINMDAPLPDPRGNTTAASSPLDYYRPVTDPVRRSQRLEAPGYDAVPPSPLLCTLMTDATALSESRPPRGATAKDRDRSSTQVHHPTQLSPISFSPSCKPRTRPEESKVSQRQMKQCPQPPFLCTIASLSTTPPEGPFARASTTSSARKGRREPRHNGAPTGYYHEPTVCW
jgi:hypothetical protein